MDYRLFYAKESASDGVRVILEEIGVPYELIQSTKDRSKPRPPEQLEINPNGWVPVLLYGGNIQPTGLKNILKLIRKNWN